MRSPTFNPLHLPSACFPQANGEVLSAEEKRRRRSTCRADSRLLRRPRLGRATTSLRPLATPHWTLFSYSHVPQYPTVLFAPHRGFNTHSAAVGPRFSTTDF